MSFIVDDKPFSFKDLEQGIFRNLCYLARRDTKEFLEKYDKHLMKTRDTKAYRHKGIKKTSIKTVYGEVEYSRRIYKVTRDNGKTEFVFLLDESLDISGVGLISHNMAEQLVSGITESTYRECARQISSSTGQTISPMGVWNVIQALGDEVCEDEKNLVKAHKAGRVKGERNTPVLFEETDGVILNLQNEKQKKAELKIGIAYDGWKEQGKDKYALDGRLAVAGFSSSKEFLEYREATIAEKYNTDDIEVRVLNADGASWTKEATCGKTIFQLDPFHRNKAIKENIPNKKAINDIHDCLKEKDIEGAIEYIRIYKDSISDDDEIEKAEKLLTYFKNNKEGLLPYQERTELPEHPDGLIYRNMGTMENHVWSIIAKRMKHGHKSWSIRGGNNLAKILAKKYSGRLDEVAAKLKKPLFEPAIAKEIEKDVLSATDVSINTGNGYEYPYRVHLPALDMPLRGDRRTLLSMAGF